MAPQVPTTLLCGAVVQQQNHNSHCGGDSLPDTLHLHHHHHHHHHAIKPPITVKQEFEEEKQPTTPTLFPFFSSFSPSSSFISVKQEPQEFEEDNINNNSVSPIHAVPIRQYNPPDHLCLHLLLAPTPSNCPSCSNTTAHHPLPFKKRKPNTQQQTQKKNKKARLNNVNDDDVVVGNPTSTLCLHLSFGTPTCSCHHHHTNKTKRAQQETNTKTTNNVDDNNQWEIKKVLKGSDISANLGRLLFNRDLAYAFVIPVLGDAAAEAAQQKDGIQVQVWDVDKQSLHSLAFKIWPSAQSHVFTKTWIKDFVDRRELKKGDEIGICWDPVNRRFDFSVLARS